MWAVQRSKVSPGDDVLVDGAGPIGLIAAQCPRAYGAASVTVTDVVGSRLQVARRLGFDAVNVAQTPLTPQGLQADVLSECSGNARFTWDAVMVVRRAGRVVLVGMGGDEVAVPLSRVQDHELVITGAFRYANTWPTASALVASGAVDLDALVTGTFGLDDVEAALTASRDNPDAMKTMVRPGRTG